MKKNFSNEDFIEFYFYKEEDNKTFRPQWHNKHHSWLNDTSSPFGSFTYRMIDGSGNNEHNLGAAHSVFTTVSGSAYSDGYSSPAGQDRPGARDLSNEIFAQNDANIPSTINASNFLWMWGQFLDHDIDLTAEGHGESFNILCPTGDAYFDPYYTGTVEITMARSGAAEGTGTDIEHPRQQINQITAFIDASSVYGSDPDRAAALRGDGGYMKLSQEGYLPYNEDGLVNGNANPFLDGADLFLAGDVRANENVALTTMHTIFVREHNRLVDVLRAKYPDMDAEALYQNARAIVEAEVQAITYNEFLPLIVGADALAAYQGYNPGINPQITSEFSTAVFRIGHTMLSATIARLKENGDIANEGHLALQRAFFNPEEITANGIESLLRGQAATKSQAIDTFIVDDVRNFLFGPPGAGGFDLVSLNIQRGRDHGLPDFNSVRKAYGLDAYDSFDDITSDSALADKLATLYGDINNIDLYVGGLAEDNADGAVVGETFQAILVQQFTALRDGDAFWFESRFDGELLEDLQGTNLSDIIRRNSDVDYLQQDIFIASQRIGGTDGRDDLYGSDENDLIIGFGQKDRLSGMGGNDTIYGGDGNDLLYGGNGDDFLAGEAGKDLLDGGAGDDMFLYGESDTYIGGSGMDTLLFEDSRDHLNFDSLGICSGIDLLDFDNDQQDTVYIDFAGILSKTDDGSLYIRGDDGLDRVVMQGGNNDISEAGSTTSGGIEYAAYRYNEVSLFLEHGLLVG